MHDLPNSDMPNEHSEEAPDQPTLPDLTTANGQPGFQTRPLYSPYVAPATPSPYPAPSLNTPRRLPRARWLFLVGAILLLLVGCGIGATLFNPIAAPARQSAAQAQSATTVPVPASATDLQQTIINVIRAVQPSVVEVQSQGAQGGAIGSGEIITSDGYIITNDHVVAGFTSYAATLSNGKTVSARLVGQDAQDDLAVLKVSAGALQPIAFGDSSKAQVGEFAIAIGSPLGLQQSATFGIVSALNRSASEAPQGPAGVLTGLIQTSAPINPGNSGGALVNLQGQLIGVPTLGAVDPNSGSSAAGIGFAIPSDRVQFVEKQLIQHGKLTSTGQGFLGIQGADVTPQVAAANNLPVQSGVIITGFVPDAAGQSPAQRAGLRTGDIIIAVNGQSVNDNAGLAGALVSQRPGATVTLRIARNSSQTDVRVTLGERPTNLNG